MDCVHTAADLTVRPVVEHHVLPHLQRCDLNGQVSIRGFNFFVVLRNKVS